MAEIRIIPSRTKSIKGFLSYVIVLGLSIAALFSQDIPAWLSWPFVILFGVPFPFFAWIYFRKRPLMIINATGIFSRQLNKKQIIPWEMIDNFEPKMEANLLWLRFIIDKRAVPHVKRNKAPQGFRRLMFNTGNMALPLDELVELLYAVQHAPQEQREEVVALYAVKLAPWIGYDFKKDS